MFKSTPYKSYKLIIQMSDQERKFDGIFMTVMQNEKQINGFFDRVYGFLRRNTDFFANQKLAEEAITSNCKKHFQIYQKDIKTKAELEQKRKKKEEQKKKAQQAPQQAPVEVKKQTPKVEVPAKVEQPGEETKEGEKEKDEPAPKGNGGKNERYIWTQTLEELHIYIPIRSDINKKFLSVKIKTDSLLVQQNGQAAIIDGKFHEKINAEDSLWTIQQGQIDDYKGKFIHLSIQKWKNQSSWWPTPIKGDAEINTQKINPEPSQLSELEGQTKSTVEKMMFDMRQKQMGKPSSDQLLKQQKLQEFMKAHPEMDFSKCKFN